MFAQTGNCFSAFILSALIFHVEALMIIWVWDEETQLNPNELQNNLLLATEMYGYNVWKRAAEQGNLQALD